ncbi:unnamed protein product [Lepeophtheirus salmonis]|uniref:(salmon louse) hypothetical protein n=1 Tax=Lepeophtheirus salmonis TaxID=72036 RepID=A0A7R8CJF7_LEPSM|nr:unnamed protein product [Lepeophtheirus salmonis]CAF2839647.1 unnamed protein product [Lepeophtheirus salmonis]
MELLQAKNVTSCVPRWYMTALIQSHFTPRGTKRDNAEWSKSLSRLQKITHAMYKQVTDAWNGYHGIPKAIEDIQLTTFITPLGSGGERILGNDDGDWFELEKVSWEGLVEATNSDNIMLNLKATLTDNKPIIRSKLPEHLHGFCGFIFHAFMWSTVLSTLQSAHLGTSSMMVPVIATVVWPNLTVDLKKSQELCCSCNSIALSQAGIPPTQYVLRSTPFQAIVADYYERELPLLGISTRVLVQNQSGNHLTKWDRSGIVMEVRPHHQYKVKVNGTDRLTLRNCKFLRPFTDPLREGLNYVPSISYPPLVANIKDSSQEEENINAEDYSITGSIILLPRFEKKDTGTCLRDVPPNDWASYDILKWTLGKDVIEGCDFLKHSATSGSIASLANSTTQPSSLAGVSPYASKKPELHSLSLSLFHKDTESFLLEFNRWNRFRKDNVIGPFGCQSGTTHFECCFFKETKVHL